MPFAKGDQWGTVGPFPEGAPIVGDDGELHRLLNRPGRTRPPVVGLTGGDLWRTLGGRPDADRFESGPVALLPCDLWRVDHDLGVHRMIAHLIVGAVRPNRRIVGAFSAAHLGRWNPAPRAHPGDGLLDLLDATLPLRVLIAARRRLATGSHLPHPAIAQRRVSAVEIALDRPSRLRIDGLDIGAVSNIAITLEPDPVRMAV